MQKNSDLFEKFPIALLIILSLMTFLLLRDIGNNNLGYPDADRILMDGIFLHDFMRDMPFAHIYDYTVRYFAQYPALSIGYRPPFFPFIEALFNNLFGVTMVSSRLAVVAFVLLGAIAWYQLVYKIFDALTAFFSLLLYATTPFLVQLGWYSLSELPVLSMALITSYFYYRYTETNQAKYFYIMAILFVLTVWTKQTAVFLALWFVLYALLTGQLITYLKRKEIWLAIILIVILLAPLAMITLWLGKKNIAQSVGSGGAFDPSYINWSALSFYWQKLYTTQLSKPAFFLALLGITLSVYHKDKKVLYFLLLIVSTYLFFSYLHAKNPRYTIFWLPAFCVLAALPVYYLKQHRNIQRLFCAILFIVIAYQLYGIYKKQPNFATGYDTTARYVLKHSSVPTVFFDGYNNGYFTFFMRIFDSQRSHFILRGDKLLSSSSVFSRSNQTIHAHNYDDFKNILTQYGVDLVVVESRNEIGIAIHDDFRSYLKTVDFKLLTTIPVDSNRSPLINQQLLIYRFLERKPISTDYLELHLPIVGQVIRVPME